MLPPLASVDQLGARLGSDPTGSEYERAFAVLNDVSALVRSVAGLDWVTEDDGDIELDDVPDIIVAVTVAVAYRAYQNPTGATQSSVGDVSVSYGREGVTGAIYLTPDERRAVRRAAGASSAGTVELVSPYYPAASAYYVPVEGGGDPIPIGPFPWESY
jgi:hypothetical protein